MSFPGDVVECKQEPGSYEVSPLVNGRTNCKLKEKVQWGQVRASGELVPVVIRDVSCLVVYFAGVALRPWGRWSEGHVQCKLTCSKLQQPRSHQRSSERVTTRLAQSSVDVTEAVRICCGGAFSRNVCEANLSHTQAISAVEASGRGYEIIMLLGTFLCVPARRTPSVWMCLVVTYGDNIS
jgi:hypothetical protein